MTTKEQVSVQLLKLPNKLPDEPTKAYKRRWIILLFFILYSGVNSFQWIEYSSITSIVVKYYQVSSLAVDWTSIIYMATYPFLVIPASYVIEKKGLRVAGLLGCLGTLVGTALKVFSIDRDRFYIVLIGQAIASASQLVILCLPPKIAAVWFNPNELSTACSLGVFGTQLGCAIGFIVPPMLVQQSNNMDDIGAGFKILCWSITIVMIPVSLAVIFYFPKQPPLPPSLAQAEERKLHANFKTSKFFSSIKDLFRNKGFNIHMTAYAINIGVFSAIGTLLSQFILAYFPDCQEDAGRMGFVLILAGMIGSVVFGIILDKTRKYKEVVFFIYLMSSASVGFFMLTLEMKSKIWTYVSCAIVGIFTNAYMPVGFEMAIELTYPSEESTTAGILMAMTQVLGAIFAAGLGHLNILIGPFWSLATQGGLLAIGTVITAFVPNNLRRQRAFQQATLADAQKTYNFSPVPTNEKEIVK